MNIYTTMNLEFIEDNYIAIIVFSLLFLIFLILLFSPKFLFKSKTSNFKRATKENTVFPFEVKSKDSKKTINGKQFIIYIKDDSKTIKLLVPRHIFSKLKKGDIILVEKITYTNIDTPTLVENHYEFISIKRRA